MIDLSPMGPGFFIFFQTDRSTSGGYKEREFVDYGTIGERRSANPEEEKVEAIIDRLAETVIETKSESKEADIELILRLRLEIECIEFKMIYLTWLLDSIRRERYNKAIVLLLLN